MSTTPSTMRERTRWLRPLAALLVFGIAAVVLHRGLAQFNFREVLAHSSAIPARSLGAALLLTAASYWLLGFYDVLALRYVAKRISYGRAVFTAFIAYAFGHNLTLAGFTGAAVRLRMYASSGITALEIATISGFCSLTAVLGLAALAGASLLLEPAAIAETLHFPLRRQCSPACFCAAWSRRTCYGLVRAPARSRSAAGRCANPVVRSRSLSSRSASPISRSRAPCCGCCCRPRPPSAFPAFAGVYAAAIAAGMLSHVPGGLGVFEAAVVLMLPDVPIDELLGSLLAYRAVYYVAAAADRARCCSPARSCARSGSTWRGRKRSRRRTSRRSCRRSRRRSRSSRAACCSCPARRPASIARIGALRELLPLAMLEVSHLVGSLIGAGARACSRRSLRRRVNAAYHITVWLLVAGIAASLLKGLDVEEALLLALVAARAACSAAARSIGPRRFSPSGSRRCGSRASSA